MHGHHIEQFNGLVFQKFAGTLYLAVTHPYFICGHKCINI